jgi:diacylglycerol kinase (ATP)
MIKRSNPYDSDPKHFLRGRIHSFECAFSGLVHVFKTQPNIWIHLAFTIAVGAVGLWLKINQVQWLVLILVIGLVWTAEILNTALEVIVNIASPERHPLAKLAKDVAAGAVLIAAIVAIVVGIIVLGPALLQTLGF